MTGLKMSRAYIFGETMQPEMATIVARLAEEDAGLPDPTLIAPKEARLLAEQTNSRWNRDLPAMEAREVSDLAGLGFRCRLVAPPGAAGLILHLHGGGWSLCSIDTHERTCRCLAAATGMAVLSIDYRLAPEHPFPAGLDDCRLALAALPALADLLGLPHRLGIAGDSAGANLALAAMLATQAEGGMLPDFGLLFYGVYENNPSTPSHHRYGVGYGLTTERMGRYWSWYAPEPADRHDPLAAPLHASTDALARLPPLYLNAAGLDPLLCDSLALAARLDMLGRKDTLHVHDGVIHGFMQMTTVLGEARDAFTKAGDWVAGLRKMGGKT